MFAKITTLVAASLGLLMLTAAASPVAKPSCCIKNAYCCSVKARCCPNAANDETTVAVVNSVDTEHGKLAKPSCCIKHAYCCSIKRPCCPDAISDETAP